MWIDDNNLQRGAIAESTRGTEASEPRTTPAYLDYVYGGCRKRLTDACGLRLDTCMDGLTVFIGI